MFRIIGIFATIALIFWLGESVGFSGIEKFLQNLGK